MADEKTTHTESDTHTGDDASPTSETHTEVTKTESTTSSTTSESSS